MSVIMRALINCCCERVTEKKLFPFWGQQNLPLPAVKGAARKPQESNRCTPVVKGCRSLPKVYTVGPRRLFAVGRKLQALMNPYFLSLQQPLHRIDYSNHLCTSRSCTNSTSISKSPSSCHNRTISCGYMSTPPPYKHRWRAPPVLSFF
jgi:hypothetical protein